MKEWQERIITAFSTASISVSTDLSIPTSIVRDLINEPPSPVVGTKHLQIVACGACDTKKPVRANILDHDGISGTGDSPLAKIYIYNI
jgi:hypothetical protein